MPELAAARRVSIEAWDDRTELTWTFDPGKAILRADEDATYPQVPPVPPCPCCGADEGRVNPEEPR